MMGSSDAGTLSRMSLRIIILLAIRRLTRTVGRVAVTTWLRQTSGNETLT
jgi:hypothetical protein